MSARLILASTSRYRRALLSRLDVPFDVDAPRFDERSLDDRFGQLDEGDFALELARGKAESLRDAHPQAWILAADQIAVLPGAPRVLLHKPETEGAAVDQLMQLRARTHTLTTGVVLLNASSGQVLTAVDQQRLHMRAFERDEAAAYVTKHRPLDCVGSYRIEDAGIRLFDRIEAEDCTGIEGLPLLRVCTLLRHAKLIP